MKGIMKYVNRISRNCEMVYSSQLKEYGISQSHHPYILLICRESGISQEMIAKEIGVNRSNVTRQLATLEEKGFITRQQDSLDRRIWRVYPTAKMQEILPEARRIMQEWNNSILADLSEEEQEQLRATLEKIANKAQSVNDELKERK